MVVHGLKDFVFNSRHLRGCIFLINIIDEIKIYTAIHEIGPLIVFDFKPFVRIPVETGEALCGGRWKKLLERLEKFIIALKDAGARLVFFIDDPLEEEWQTEWLQVKTREYKKMIKVIPQLKKGRKASCLKDMVNQKRILDFSKEYLIRNLEKYGMWKRPLESDEPLECPRYAKEKEAFAIFTENLDFLIYEGEYRIWSVKKINFEKLTTNELHKSNVCRQLGLSSAQMPIFAMLCGHEVMNRAYLKKLHDQFDANSKIKGVAKFAKDWPDIHHFLEHEIHLMSEYLGCSNDTIKESLKLYDLSTEDMSLVVRESPFLLWLRDEYTPHQYLSYKLGQHMHITSVYENLLRPSFKQTQQEVGLWLERCRIGIILKNKKKQSRQTIYAMINPKDGYKAHVEDPIYPVFDVPPLEKLMQRFPNDNLDGKRMDLLRAALCDYVDVRLLMQINEELAPVIATLWYLVKEVEMKKDEADLLLLTFFDMINDRISAEISAPPIINLRAFHTVFMYLSTQQHVYRLFVTVGFRVEPIPFDGVYFHTLYLKWKKMEKRDKEKHINRIYDLRLYAYKENN